MQLDLFQVDTPKPHVEYCPTCGLHVKTFLHAEWYPDHYGINRCSTWWGHDEDWRPGDPVDWGYIQHYGYQLPKRHHHESSTTETAKRKRPRLRNESKI